MSAISVSLVISADEYLKLYQGVAKSVFAKSASGETVRFPATILQPFVTREGVKGNFIIEFDNNNKFKSIKRN